MKLAERRDYSLDGPEARRAVDRGLVDARWYLPAVDPATLKALMVRSDRRAARDLALWLGLLVGLGTVAVWLFPSPWALVALFGYATLYGSSADPRWHECGHGTAFANDRANTVVYYLASFMLLREPTVWRWSHVRHHSDTIIVGRDPEIVQPRPPNLRAWVLNHLNLAAGPAMLTQTARHATGRLKPAVADFVPESEQRRVVVEARVVIAIHMALLVVSVVVANPLPALMSTLASFYGAWLLLAFGTTQHLGLAEDVLDHRLNTRTVYFNPVLRFLYLNMNYHIEHHLFPTVPYHRLPELHQAIRHELPPPAPSFAAAWREAVGSLWRQRRDPTDTVSGREIPAQSRGRTDLVTEVAVVLDGRPTANGWLDAGSAEAIAPGSVLRVDSLDDAATYALYRLADQTWAATAGICTHSRRTHLAGGVIVGDQIECPKHNGRFDIATGACTRAPAETPLEIHAVRVVDNRVQIRTRPGSTLA